MYDKIGERSQVFIVGTPQERQIARDASVEASSLQLSTAQFTPEAVNAHQSIYNQALADGSRINSGFPLLSGIKWFLSIFDDRAVRGATKPNPADNDDARQIKKEYRDAYKEAKKERAQASRIAEKLGPGVHHLSNGDTVTVRKDPKTGETTVTTKSKDGSTKTVTFDPNDPTTVSVKKVAKDGTEDDLSLDGTNVTRTHVDENGETSQSYSIDDQGRPVRETRGPNDDDDEITAVNPDGSTDTRELVYNDDNGNPVYEDRHDNPNTHGCF